MKNIVNLILAFILLACMIFVVYLIISSFFSWFKEINPQLAIALITGSSTIIVATLTVVLGKYYERLKEIESHHRARKVEIYDEFLISVFKVFYEDDSNFDLVKFLQEWQRKIIMWASPSVIKAFIDWKIHLAKSPPNAKTFFLMEDLFKAMRKDIGLSNKNLDKGAFSHFIMKEADLFLALSKENPNITLAEISEVEKVLEYQKHT
ncbi:hypothetical protein BEN76_09730 [Acinetobacter soli]|uniref:Uncharacterized protein n=1 Tax=Acinetobacter soli TaxID=487316 RepID=A0A1P8EJ93_9GAMM|nr:hypothetical protein BEN76_09730 [Acinetobacter soli]